MDTSLANAPNSTEQELYKTSTVKRELNVSPDAGEQNVGGNKKVIKCSGSTVPVAPSTNSAPNYKEPTKL